MTYQSGRHTLLFTFCGKLFEPVRTTARVIWLFLEAIQRIACVAISMSTVKVEVATPEAALFSRAGTVLGSGTLTAHRVL